MASIAAHTVYPTAGFRMRCSSRFTGSEPAVHGLAPIVPHLFHNLPLLSSPAFTPVSNSTARRQRHVRVNNLLGVVTLLRSGRGSNRRPVDCKSDHHATPRCQASRQVRCDATDDACDCQLIIIYTLSVSLCLPSTIKQQPSLLITSATFGGRGSSVDPCLSVCLFVY